MSFKHNLATSCVLLFLLLVLDTQPALPEETAPPRVALGEATDLALFELGCGRIQDAYRILDSALVGEPATDDGEAALWVFLFLFRLDTKSCLLASTEAKKRLIEWQRPQATAGELAKTVFLGGNMFSGLDVDATLLRLTREYPATYWGEWGKWQRLERLECQENDAARKEKGRDAIGVMISYVGPNLLNDPRPNLMTRWKAHELFRQSQRLMYLTSNYYKHCAKLSGKAGEDGLEAQVKAIFAEFAKISPPGMWKEESLLADLLKLDAQFGKNLWAYYKLRKERGVRLPTAIPTTQEELEQAVKNAQNVGIDYSEMEYREYEKINKDRRVLQVDPLGKIPYSNDGPEKKPKQ